MDFEKFDLSTIKKMNEVQLHSLSNDLRINILKSVSKNGGHLGSNLGIVELIVSLFKNFNFPTDKIAFDVGHQCYAYKLLTNRSLENLRQDGGTSGFFNMDESKYDTYDTGHSSTSISIATGFALNRDYKKENYEVLAFIGDGSFGNGMIYEALTELANLKTKVIIILNDNNMSITPTTETINKCLNNNKLMSTVFNNDSFEYIKVENGYDFIQLDDAFKKAKKTTKSVIVHIKTIKGYGYEFTQNDKIGDYHKVTPFDLKTGIKNTYNDQLPCQIVADYLQKNIEKDAIVINPATALSSNLGSLQNELKERFIDPGMQEENAITLASAIGFERHVYLIINSSFAQRGYDQFLHDIVRKKTHVTIILDKVGLLGADGATHQGIYDLGFLNSIPESLIATPSNKGELITLLDESKQNKSPIFIRLCAESFNEICDLGKIAIPDDTCIATYGNQYNILKSYFNGSIIKCLYQKPFDINYVSEIKKYKKVLIYDRYSTKYGFTNNLTAELIKNDYNGIIKSMEIPDTFINFGSVNKQLENCHLDKDSIVKKLEEF